MYVLRVLEGTTDPCQVLGLAVEQESQCGCWGLPASWSLHVPSPSFLVHQQLLLESVSLSFGNPVFIIFCSVARRQSWNTSGLKRRDSWLLGMRVGPKESLPEDAQCLCLGVVFLASQVFLSEPGVELRST